MREGVSATKGDETGPSCAATWAEPASETNGARTEGGTCVEGKQCEGRREGTREGTREAAFEE